ncbi:FecR family protein [Puteibacter caeruleilacunae]|nr:FecR family protein [Puteibacter caeruleilacunae]
MTRKDNPLGKYIKGTHSLNDKLEVDNLFLDDNNSQRLKEELEDYWINEEGEQADEKTLSRMLRLLHQKINTQRNWIERGGRILNMYAKVAAVLLIPLMIYSIWQHTQTTKSTIEYATAEISSPEGCRTKFYLPDGSSGWLNANSTIYYEQGPKNQRNVQLTGEAFFDVTKDKEHPFVVALPNFKIKVLGTRFNVTGFPDQNIESVVLEEGSVQVIDNNNRKVITMKPDYKVSYYKDKRKFIGEKVDAKNYIAWINGVLIFNNDPVEVMAQKLEAFYNIDVEVDKRGLEDDLFFATLENESLEDVLKFLEITSNVETKIIDRKKGTNGNYLKRKVVIKKR